MKTITNSIRRYGMITGLKPEKVDYYKTAHIAVWDAVLEKIKDCNIRNYSIYLQQIEDKYYLFSFMEYTGSDFEADMQRMAADETTQRWWQEMHPCQQPLPEAIKQGNIWTNMEEVFHQE